MWRTVEAGREIKVINTINLQHHTSPHPCYFVNSTMIGEIHNNEIFKRTVQLCHTQHECSFFFSVCWSFNFQNSGIIPAYTVTFRACWASLDFYRRNLVTPSVIYLRQNFWNYWKRPAMLLYGTTVCFYYVMVIRFYKLVIWPFYMKISNWLSVRHTVGNCP
jgi:hypothetical protein